MIVSGMVQLEARKEAGEAEALTFAETEICLELVDSEESAVASSLAVEPLKLGETRRFHKSRRQVCVRRNDPGLKP